MRLLCRYGRSDFHSEATRVQLAPASRMARWSSGMDSRFSAGRRRFESGTRYEGRKFRCSRVLSATILIFAGHFLGCVGSTSTPDLGPGLECR